MRIHNLIDDLNHFVKTARVKLKPDHPDAVNRSEMVERVAFVAKKHEGALSLPQFDVGSALCDMPDEEYEGLIGYAYELIDHDLQLFPYPAFVVSYLWYGAQMLICATIDGKELEFTGFQKHQTLPLHPGIVAKFNLNSKIQPNAIFGDLDYAHEIYATETSRPNRYGRVEEAKQCLSLLCAFGALLNAKDAKIVSTPAPAALNKSRAKKGKAPIGEIKEIRIVVGNTVRSISGHEAAGSHSAKRMHWRRGHVRRLASGQITNVRPCLVGSIHSDKVKMPTYKVTKGAA